MVNGLSMLMLAKNSVLPRICRTYSPCYAIPRAPSSLSRMREVACRGVSSVAGVALKLDSGISHPRPHSEIPGPMAWPILGTMPSMFTDPAYDSTRMPRLWESYFKKYGRIFKLNLLGQGDVIFVSDPVDIEHIYKETFENPIRPFFESLKKIRMNNKKKYFKENETGIFTECGGLRDDKNELPGEFMDELFKWALESLCLVALNKRVGCLEGSEEGQRIIKAAITMMSCANECEYGIHLWRYFPTSPLRRMWKAHDDLLEVVITKVHEAKRDLEAREAEESGELNILESLLTTPGLSFKDVVTFMMDLFFAGIDTTSSTAVFTMYNLARSPEKQTRLQQELDQVLGDGCQPLTSHHMARLTYTKACVRETLRMLPTTSVNIRKLEKDITLQGYRVKAGTKVFVSMKESGMMEEYFPRATEFLPERWMRDHPDRLNNQYASIPFSVGTRMCVGRRLAEQELYVFLARLFLKYNLEYKYSEWDPVLKPLYKPDKPQNFTMTER
ncbi:probable cytochrome P450 49a1 isoform X2 [Procambarus clarkii]|uniref:probable cytochrome P450 49a1 isoform X2 n=1 Tax=Procambarus clarkii TaxID=6728 RepID=UPI00374256F4